MSIIMAAWPQSSPPMRSFDLDLEALEAALTPRSKVVLINSPNNPTGVIYPPTTLKQLGELLQRKERQFNTQIYLLSDEPYKKLIYGGLTYPEVYPHHPNTISVTSHAKDLGLPAERIGYIAANPECADLEDLMSGLSFTTRTLGFVNAPALMQRALVSLQGVTVDMGEYERKRNFLCDNLTAMGYRLVKPQGAFYIFPEGARRGRCRLRQGAARETYPHRARTRLWAPRPLPYCLLCRRSHYRAGDGWLSGGGQGIRHGVRGESINAGGGHEHRDPWGGSAGIAVRRAPGTSGRRRHIDCT